LGDSAILIQGLGGTEIEKIIGENNEWWESNFDSITHWNAAQVIQHKIVWIKCRGLPLYLWTQQCFGKVVAPLGVLLSMDDRTRDWKCLEYARLLAKVPIGCNI